MYLPIYKSGAPYATLAQRSSNLIGWVCALFRMDDLRRGILGARVPDIDIKIYDGGEMSSKTLMHHADSKNKIGVMPPLFLLQSVLKLLATPGQWLLALSPTLRRS
jgi:hypothetical protein